MSRKANTRTPEAIIAQQKEDAKKQTASRATRAANVPAVAPQSAPPAPPTIDTRTPAEICADEACLTAIVGQLVNFNGKDGKFVIVETDEDVGNREFIAAVDEILSGYIRFNGEGEPPTRIQGQPYKGWIKPKRETLGDNDPRQWPDGPYGRKDPWPEQMNLVLIDPVTRAFFTFATTSPTGRSGVGALMQHYNRMIKHDPDSYPVVRLVASGYEHKQYGWVHKPVFAITGRTPKNSAAVPDTSVAADLNDKIPF